MVEFIQKNWWLIALRGVFAILFGLIAFFSPVEALLSMLTFFAFFLLLSGFAIITQSLFGKSANKWLEFFEGLIFVITGVLIVSNPAFITGSVMILIAVWAVISGIFSIINAINLRKVITNEWLMILNGAVTVLFGIAVASNVLVSAIAITTLFGIFAIISGIFIVILSFRIKNLRNTE